MGISQAAFATFRSRYHVKFDNYALFECFAKTLTRCLTFFWSFGGGNMIRTNKSSRRRTCTNNRPTMQQLSRVCLIASCLLAGRTTPTWAHDVPKLTYSKEDYPYYVSYRGRYNHGIRGVDDFKPLPKKIGGFGASQLRGGTTEKIGKGKGGSKAGYNDPYDPNQSDMPSFVPSQAPSCVLYNSYSSNSSSSIYEDSYYPKGPLAGSKKNKKHKSDRKIGKGRSKLSRYSKSSSYKTTTSSTTTTTSKTTTSTSETTTSTSTSTTTTSQSKSRTSKSSSSIDECKDIGGPPKGPGAPPRPSPNTPRIPTILMLPPIPPFAIPPALLPSTPPPQNEPSLSKQPRNDPSLFEQPSYEQSLSKQ